ncbi:glutamine amidotransferase [Paenalcaligenes niemegkensis]|uniref:glutamine amidotransferase n=1 Tax=Paenalcaligenes niemegkensis TaxID=2895469 RepID=UPI001EE919F3|nr:glutamine amidotransferase [Paenalcaligenes niemegkensis]MCQ9616231.1 glutamine amidotransferase [Paenalcaligenes niemegkensis]
MQAFLLIQADTPPTTITQRVGDQRDWFRQAIEIAHQVPIVAVNPAADTPLPNPADYSGVIISGSWAMVTDRAAWSERTAEWLKQAHTQDTPLLGICYGHQLLAHALGASIGNLGAGREFGTFTVDPLPEAVDDPLTYHLKEPFLAHLSHLQTVLQLPAKTQVLARSKMDPHQILRYGPHALSVQFHPEFTPGIMQACLLARLSPDKASELDPSNHLTQFRNTPVARQILHNFIERYRQPAPDAEAERSQ